MMTVPESNENLTATLETTPSSGPNNKLNCQTKVLSFLFLSIWDWSDISCQIMRRFLFVYFVLDLIPKC